MQMTSGRPMRNAVGLRSSGAFVGFLMLKKGISYCTLKESN